MKSIHSLSIIYLWCLLHLIIVPRLNPHQHREENPRNVYGCNAPIIARFIFVTLLCSDPCDILHFLCFNHLFFEKWIQHGGFRTYLYVACVAHHEDYYSCMCSYTSSIWHFADIPISTRFSHSIFPSLLLRS